MTFNVDDVSCNFEFPSIIVEVMSLIDRHEDYNFSIHYFGLGRHGGEMGTLSNEKVITILIDESNSTM